MISLCYATFTDKNGDFHHKVGLMNVLLEKGMH
jgi:hypothetical protein